MRATRTLPRHWALGALALGLILAANGCAQKKDEPQGPLAIIGTYIDAFGCSQTITATNWTTTVDVPLGCGGTYHIVEYFNAAMFLIALNGTDTFNPGAWSRFDWVAYAPHLYYCQTAYAAATQADAEDTPPANAADLAGGCDGTVNHFPWTQLQ
jgi:hypothetical protein